MIWSSIIDKRCPPKKSVFQKLDILGYLIYQLILKTQRLIKESCKNHSQAEAEFTSVLPWTAILSIYLELITTKEVQ